MISLVETGLMNALLAAFLGLPILVLARLWQRPALVHAFWILVLLKLVSPPLYQIQLPWQLPTSVTGQSQLQLTGTAVLSHSPVLDQQPSVFWQLLVTTLSILEAVAVPVLIVWLAGSVVWFLWQGWRVVRFAQVFLRSAQYAPESLQQKARELAAQMGMQSCPGVWLLPAVVSPMLWSVGGRPRILFPTELLTRLDDCAVATLLTHELAHYRRGDHRVRLLEFVASGLFWWHPIVWVARRELEISEEQCCDAWVVSQFPALERRYADALLATVDFLSGDHPPVPAVASGLGDVPLLRQRLKMIMCGTTPKSLSLLGRLAVLLAALLIPVSPTLRGRTPPDAITKSLIANTTVTITPPAKLEVVHTRVARVREDLARLSQSVQTSRATRNGLKSTHLIESTIAADSQPRSSSFQASSTELTPAAFKSPRTQRRVWATATAPDGSSRVVAWTNGVVEWQSSNQETRNLSLFRISTILYSADSQLFMSGCRDGLVRVWNATNGELLFQLEGHQASVRALALSPDGEQLASADQNGVVLLWLLNGTAEPRTLTRGCTSVNSLAFSADGHTLALGTGRRLSNEAAQVQVWDLATESLVTSLDHTSALALVRLSPDGKSVTGAEWNGTLLTWDLESAKVVAKQHIDRYTIPARAFAPQS